MKQLSELSELSETYGIPLDFLMKLQAESIGELRIYNHPFNATRYLHLRFEDGKLIKAEIKGMPGK